MTATCCNTPMRTHYGDGLPRPEPWCSVCGRKGLPPNDSGNWVDLATGEPIYSRTTKSKDMRPLTNPVFTINRASDDGLAGFTDDLNPKITIVAVLPAIPIKLVGYDFPALADHQLKWIDP